MKQKPLSMKRLTQMAMMFIEKKLVDEGNGVTVKREQKTLLAFLKFVWDKKDTEL